MERDPAEVDRRGGMIPEKGAKAFPDDMLEAWTAAAEDLKLDPERWRTDYWFKKFPKGYFMYDTLSGDAYLYSDRMDLVDDRVYGRIDDFRTMYFRLFTSGTISADPDARLDLISESWLYWGLK